MNPIAFRELSPVNHLERAAAVFGRRTAVLDDDISYTYAEMWVRVQQFAGLLAERGVNPGDRVAVLAPNTHTLLEAHYAVPLAGAVLVALNTRLAPSEIAYILQHSGSRMIIVDRNMHDLANDAVAQSDLHGIGMVFDDELQTLIPNAPCLRVPVQDERSLLSINYTSGTTGQPKGVMYHHRGAWLQALAMAYHAGLVPSSRYLWTLPMFHTNGWCFPWAVTAAGGTHYCLRTVSPSTIWEKILDSGITHFCAAPTVLAMLADAAPAERPQKPVHVFAGGAPPWPALLAQMAELGIDIQHLYGLTETFGPAVVCQPQPEWKHADPTQLAQLISRQGIANVVAEPVRVIDANEVDVPADGTSMGEICLRGNNVMLGYYQDEHATAQATTSDGWFRTGDLGVMHPDGYIEIQDRKKDVIISGGENITSVEIENALTTHQDVIEAAVVAAPDEKWGEVPIAFVVLRQDSAVTETELISHVKEKIARFKAPRQIVFGDLPKTSTGKIQKNDLRTQAAIKNK